MINDDYALPERCSDCNALLFSHEAQFHGLCHDCRQEADDDNPCELEDRLDAALEDISPIPTNQPQEKLL